MALPPVRIPEKMGAYEERFIGPLTIKQTMMLIPGLFAALIVSMVLPEYGIMPMGGAERAAAGIISFGIFAVFGAVQREGVPLLLYLCSTLKYKRRPKKYVKAEKEGKQPYPATQSWTTLQDIYKDIAVYKDNRYAAMLKVIPVPIDLKPEADRDSFYVKYRAFLNSLDFPLITYIRPEQYDPTPYVNSYTLRLEDYKDNPRMYELVQNEIDAFKEYIEDAKPIEKTFFILIPVAIEKIKPKLLAKEKEALNQAKTPQEKAALAEKYSQKKLEAAARELRLRKRVSAIALQSVDPDLAVEELADKSLEEAMRTLFEFAAIPPEEEEV